MGSLCGSAQNDKPPLCLECVKRSQKQMVTVGTQWEQADCIAPELPRFDEPTEENMRIDLLMDLPDAEWENSGGNERRHAFSIQPPEDVHISTRTESIDERINRGSMF